MSTEQSNPLIDLVITGGLPDFTAIEPEHAQSAVERMIEAARQTVEACIADNATPTWDNLIDPVDIAGDRLGRAFSPASHLHSVMDSPAWREAYQACRPLITAFSSEMGQHSGLFEAVSRLAESDEYARLDAHQQRVIDKMLRDFKLSGVALDDASKATYKDMAQRRSELATTFQQNLLDATQAWRRHVSDGDTLAGLPQSALDMLAQNAANKNMDGWLVTLDGPSLMAVLSHAANRELRREVYEAFTTRASDAGPQAGQFDNSALMDEILSLRHGAAEMLGFANYAERSIATKMADSTDAIERFLLDLAARTRSRAQSELDDLRELARADGIESLQAWDVGYYAEQLKQARYDFSDEDLRPYFSAPDVIDGLFRVVGRLYGIRIQRREDINTWHRDVTVYEIRDGADERRGIFYLDPYAREGKRGGAWMDGFQSRRRHSEGVQLPVAFLTCNFSPPIGNKPALLTHDEVTTLFHEFGHGLHHMLTQVDYAPIAGIAGVEWDAVELPSQFMENWCWARESLDLFARHQDTGEPLPEALFDKLNASRNHMAGWQMLRQVEFALFDLRLHRDFDPATGADVLGTLDTVRREVAVMASPAFNRFPHSFQHIFAGGYAAGYYSYKWAEVLSADAFSAFEETSLFDPDTGQRFMREVLERGATRNAMDSFVAFRGRTPSIDALLRHAGLDDSEAA